MPITSPDIADYLSEIDISVCFSELAKMSLGLKPKIDTSLDFEILADDIQSLSTL